MADHLTRRTAEPVLPLPAKEVVLLTEEAVEDPGRAVRAAEVAQDDSSRPRPVDPPVRLPEGRLWDLRLKLQPDYTVALFAVGPDKKLIPFQPRGGAF